MLKRQCQEIFCFRIFHESSSPQAPANNCRVENSRRYSQVKVHHRCQRQWQITLRLNNIPWTSKFYIISVRQTTSTLTPKPGARGAPWCLSSPIELLPREYGWALKDAINCIGYCLLVIIGQKTEYAYTFHTSSNLRSRCAVLTCSCSCGYGCVWNLKEIKVSFQLHTHY